MTVLIGYYTLHETMRALELVNMMISFIGVMIIIMFSTNYTNQETYSGEKISGFNYLMGILANILSAVLFAVGNVIIRYLKDVDSISLNALYGTSSFFVSLMSLFIYRLFVNRNNFVYNLTGFQCFLLIGNGVLVTVAIQLYIKAFQLDKAGRAASLWFLAIVVGYIFDITVYKYQM
jgi:drug/metabolite transporter (DMT)-like permease